MMGVLAGVDWGEVTSAELVVSTCGGSRNEVTRQLLPYMDIGRGDERGASCVHRGRCPSQLDGACVLSDALGEHRVGDVSDAFLVREVVRALAALQKG